MAMPTYPNTPNTGAETQLPGSRENPLTSCFDAMSQAREVMSAINSLKEHLLGAVPTEGGVKADPQSDGALNELERHANLLKAMCLEALQNIARIRAAT